MIESQYTSNIHKRLPPEVYSWKINDNFCSGVPDAFYRHLTRGGHLWIEYKFLKSMPKRDDTIVKPNLSSTQALWLQQAHDAGEKVRIIVGVGDHKINRQTAGAMVNLSQALEGISVVDLRDQLLSYDGICLSITALLENK